MPRWVGQVPGDVVLAADHLVPQRLGQRPRDGRRDGRDESHPEAGQAGGEDRHGHDETPVQPRHPRVPGHHVPVGEDVRPADVEGPVHVVRQARAADQQPQHVPYGDGLDAGAHPAGRDHHREPFGQVAQHLEGGRARADDHGGTQDGGRHPGRQQHAAHFRPGPQVRGEPVLGHSGGRETAEIHDAPHTGCLRPFPEDAGRAAVGVLEVLAAAERVHQVVGHVDVPHRRGDRVRVRDIPSHHFRLTGPRVVAQLAGGAGQTAHPVTGGQQLGHQPAADVARGSGHQAAEPVRRVVVVHPVQVLRVGGPPGNHFPPCAARGCVSSGRPIDWAWSSVGRSIGASRSHVPRGARCPANVNGER